MEESDISIAKKLRMNKQSMGWLHLSEEAQETILADIYQRAEIEACGVLLGKKDEEGNWYAEQACPLQNIFHSPVYFEFAPEELLEVELQYPDGIIGVYHSHPTGFPRASSTDKENMRRVNEEQHIPWAWLIIAGPFTTSHHQVTGAELSPEKLIAYHHYVDTGLQHIAVHLADRGKSLG